MADARGAVAQADRAFGLRESFNVHGDVTGTGNTLLTCVDTDSLCPAARRGDAGTLGDNNNNSRPMRYVDIDDVAGTFNSSSAFLPLPAGAKVEWAGLYWGGRWQAGDKKSGYPEPVAGNRNALGTVKMRPPGATGYASYTSDIGVDDAGPGRIYQAFKEITGIVQASGRGRYMVADVQLGTGLHSDQSGGWAILVAYSDPGEPLRNLTVFDGLKFVVAEKPDEPVDIPLSGFLTPPAPAPVKTRVGLVAYEGDIGIVGDNAVLNHGLATAKRLENPANPQNNFFNSSISDPDGTILTDRNPDDRNIFGFDGDFFESDQYLSNGQRQTTLRLSTNGDGYAPGAVLFSTDLFAPKIEPVKSVDKAVAQAGEVLTYQVAVRNTGLDPATNVAFRDAIPASTDYVEGSLNIVAGANQGPKTDAVDGDAAEFVAGGVNFRLGELAVNGSATVQFKVRVHSLGLPLNSRIVNSGTVGFKSKTLDEPGQEKTNEVSTRVILPDLEVQKTHTGDFEAGGSATFEIAVRNVGEAPTQGPTVVTDTLPPKVTLDGTPSGNGWSCEPSTDGFRCERSDPLAAGASFPTIRARVQISEDAAGSKLVNVARVTTPGDPNDLNDTDTDGGDVPLPDLAIDKVALTPEVFPEQEVRYLITVLNRGPVRATNVTVSEELPLDVTILTVKPEKGECGDRVCRLGTLLKGETVKIEVTGVTDRDSGGRTLPNEVRVDARQNDLNPEDNVDGAIVRVKPKADIVVEKSAAAPTLAAGGIAQFLVVVRNDGPSAATDVVLNDIVPPGLQPLAFAPSQGTCEGTQLLARHDWPTAASRRSSSSSRPPRSRPARYS